VRRRSAEVSRNNRRIPVARRFCDEQKARSLSNAVRAADKALTLFGVQQTKAFRRDSAGGFATAGNIGGTTLLLFRN
jgi:hypothetical protein